MFDTLIDLTIKEIKEALEEVNYLVDSESILSLEQDKRPGVNRLAETCKKAKKHYYDEQARLKKLFEFEFSLLLNSY